MYKILLALTVFFGGLTGVCAQEQPVVKTDPNGQIGYSESTPYEPRKFDGKKKPKKEKKRKTDELVNSNAAVKIPLFVYDAKGNPVTDLKNSEIKLLFDDKEHEVLALEPAGSALDILLVVDTSPSTVFNEKDLRNFVTKLTDSLKPEDKIQIISFNSEINVLSESTNDREIIRKAIKKLNMGSGTSIYETVKTIFQKHLKSDNGQKTVIFLSDGVDTTSYDADFVSSLRAAEMNNSPVFSFYLTVAGPQPGMTKEDYELGFSYMMDLANLSGGRTFHIKDMAAIQTDELKALLPLLKPQYLISFKPLDADTGNRSNQLKLRVNRPNLTVQMRGRYF